MKNLILLLFLCSFSWCQAQPGNNIFDDSFLHEIRFENADTANWIATKDYQMLDVIIDGNTVDSVGFKRKGNISQYPSTNKYGIKVKSNKYVRGKYYDGIKEFTLHMNYQDPTMMREKLTYDICDELGLFSLRTAFAKVYINNVYWGLYTIVEGKDEMYKHIFGDRSSNAIESLDFGSMCYIGNNVADYDYSHPSSIFPRYILSNGDSATTWPSFINMLDKANNTSNSEYLDTLANYFNVQDFFKYQAVNTYLMNFDSYIGFLGNQIYVHDTINKIWQVTPWDFNASFGLWETGSHSPNNYPIIPNRISTGCIGSKIDSVPQLKSYYLDAMCELNDLICDTTAMHTKITTWKNQIQQAVYDDYRKVASNLDFDNGLEYGYYNVHGLPNVPGLKTFLSERYTLIKQGLANENYTCTVGIEEDENATLNINLYPNPFKSDLTIELNLIEQLEVDVFITNLVGKRVSQTKNYSLNTGNNKLNWNASNLSNGVYLLNVKTANSVHVKKLIVNR